MRLAYVTETYPPDVNSVALIAARTVNHVRVRGHDVDLIRPCRRGELRHAQASEWLAWSCALPLCPDVPLGWTRPAELRARFVHWQPDLVHIATAGPLGLLAACVAKSLGLPVTADFRGLHQHYGRHHPLGWSEPLTQRLLHALHGAADVNFVATPELWAALNAAQFERLALVGRGVDADQFSPRWRSTATRASWGAGPHDPVLLYVGRLAAEKNIELALAAWAQARASDPRVRMVVVGDGPLRSALAREWPAVTFTGTLTGEALSRTYASADIFLFPSESEAFGGVTLEAMASGLCVLAFDLGAASTLIESGLNGVLVRPGDESGFCLAVAQAVRDLPEMDTLRTLARAQAERIDWSQALDEQLRAMVALVERSRALTDCTPCAI